MVAAVGSGLVSKVLVIFPFEAALYDRAGVPVEFVGHPLRKDYPIERTQPLVPYRQGEGLTKLPPFGLDEGQPFARIQWQERLKGRDQQVSPAIAVQVGQKRALSETSAHEGGAKAEE